MIFQGFVERGEKGLLVCFLLSVKPIFLDTGIFYIYVLFSFSFSFHCREQSYEYYLGGLCINTAWGLPFGDSLFRKCVHGM